MNNYDVSILTNCFESHAFCLKMSSTRSYVFSVIRHATRLWFVCGWRRGFQTDSLGTASARSHICWVYINVYIYFLFYCLQVLNAFGMRDCCRTTRVPHIVLYITLRVHLVRRSCSYCSETRSPQFFFVFYCRYLPFFFFFLFHAINYYNNIDHTYIPLVYMYT